MKKLLIILMAATLGAIAASSRIMWSVTAPGQSQPCGWLIGTMHTTDGADMPRHITDVIDSADIVVVEIADENFDMGRQSMSVILVPADSMLTRLFTPAQLDSLAAVTDTVLNISRGSDMWHLFMSLKPALLSSRLTVALMPQHSGAAERPVDLWIRDRAANAGAEIIGLETVEQQLAMILGRPIAEQASDLLDCVRHLDSIRTVGHELDHAYYTGDINYIETLCDESPGWLVDERNREWLPRIVSLLERPERVVIAVGAAHIVGRDGLTRALTDRGYTVTFVPAQY